jgi:hypothetical protein
MAIFKKVMDRINALDKPKRFSPLERMIRRIAAEKSWRGYRRKPRKKL